jgi:hypothetical protein
MEKYDYFEAVCEDIREEIKYRKVNVTSMNKDEVYSDLYDELFVTDSVTGNASGSYTFNAWQAEENLCHNMDLLEEACNEFGYCEENPLSKGAEWCDVTIRCYLLGQALSAVLDEKCSEWEELRDKAQEWWGLTDFETMERITGYSQADFSPEDGYQDFVDACDAWWDWIDEQDKIDYYLENSNE